MNSSKLFQKRKRRMETNQNRHDLPLLKRLPFAESVEQLHRYNVHVAQVCFNTSQSLIQAYNTKKDRYSKEAQTKDEERAKAAEEALESRKKSLEGKQKELRHRNQENLAKIQHYLVERRNKLTKKEKKMMEESAIRREEYLHTLTSTFHHSQDRRSRIKQRQDNQFQRSLFLLEQNNQKVRAANQRKIELLEQTRLAIRQRNQQASNSNIEACKQRQNARREEQLQRLVKKYDAAGQHLQEIELQVEKRINDKRREDQKALQKHRKKRSNLLEELERRKQADVQRDEAKIDKAKNTKGKYFQDSLINMQSKRKQKQKKLIYNTFYLQEEAEKRTEALVHRHHASQVALKGVRAEREKIHIENLVDSFRATLRS